MRYFIANGLWFLGDDPKNQVAGTLRYSERGLQLKLLGSFRGGWSPKSEPYPVIHGVVSKNPYGDFVTLVDCFTARSSISSAGIGSEIIRCNRALVGDSHKSPEVDEFEAVDVRTSYLDSWFGRRGATTKIVTSDGFGWDVTYRTPDPVRLPVDQATLTLGMAASAGESSRRVTITEEAYIRIEPVPRLTVDQFHSDFVRPLQNLLSFATDRPNAVEKIEFRGEKVAQGKVEWNRRYHLLYDPIFRLEQKKVWLTSGDQLFSFDEAHDAGLNIFERWLQFSEAHEGFCTVYFASLYAPPRFLEEKFQRLMSAFTLLTTSLGEVSQRTVSFLDEIHRLVDDHFAEGEGARLAPIIPTGPEIEMPARLLDLLERHRPIMGQILEDDLSGFVKSVSDTLAFAERRIAMEGSKPLQGNDLYYAMQKIRILIKIIVLEAIGFDESKISEFIQRNRQFIYTRSL